MDKFHLCIVCRAPFTFREISVDDDYGNGADEDDDDGEQ